MPSQRTILAFGPGWWPLGPVAGSPRYHLHGLAGAGDRVLYVEPPQGRLRNRGASRGAGGVYRPGSVEPWPDRPLSVYHPATRLFFHPRLPLPAAILPSWNRAVLRRLAREVERNCRNMNITEWEYPDLLWLGAYHHAPLLDCVPHRKSAAFLYDDLPQSPAWGPGRGRLVGRLERELLERVDLAIFTSKTLLDSRQGLCRKALLLENAVSAEFFNDAPPDPGVEGHEILERVVSLPRPRIGYVGAVNLRLDFDVCRAMARAAASRGWNVVLAGVVDRYYSRGVDKLKAMPNVHAPGLVPYPAVPRLLRLFDVLILPHAVTPFTRAMFPEKLPEYLSTGRPIVSTRLPEVERVAAQGGDGGGAAGGVTVRPDDLILFADTPEAFVDQCARCLNEGESSDAATNRARARIALARRHTRDIRLAVLRRALDELFEG